MDKNIPDYIKSLCEKDNLSDPGEQELVKKKLKEFLEQYLDLKKGKNSLANVSDIVSQSGEFPVKGTNYPFERDVAGRMVRTRNYTMKEGVNKAGKDEVYIIAADRDWWDKYSGWVSLALLILGFVLGIISDPIKERIFPKVKEKINSDTVSVKVLSMPQITIPHSDGQRSIQPIPVKVK